MSQAVYIRRAKHDAENKYFLLLRSTAQDERLSFEARGLLIYLLSKPADWRVRSEDLMREGNIGRDKTKSLLALLVSTGYAQKINGHDEKGRFTQTEYVIYESPLTENPLTDKPSTGNQSPDIPPLQNGDTDSENQQITDKEEDARARATAAAAAIPEPLAQASSEEPKSSSVPERQPTGAPAAASIPPSSAAPPLPLATLPPLKPVGPSSSELRGLGMTTLSHQAANDELRQIYQGVIEDPLYRAWADLMANAWENRIQDNGKPYTARDIATFSPILRPENRSAIHSAVTTINILVSIGATPEDVERVVRRKLDAGRYDYQFVYLRQDVAQSMTPREVKSSTPEPATPIPPIPDYFTFFPDDCLNDREPLLMRQLEWDALYKSWGEKLWEHVESPDPEVVRRVLHEHGVTETEGVL